MTNSIFTSKEHYLSFRAAWAESVNTAQADGRKYGEWFGSISPEQHMLYNILRGKHAECGFTHITNTNKLDNGMYPNHASVYAFIRLHSHRYTARKIMEDKTLQIWVKERTETCLEVFKGTVTMEMLAQLDFERIKPIYIALKKVA